MKLQTILVPVDFSESAAQALERATAIAASFGARLRIFHAVVLFESDPQRDREHEDRCMKRVQQVLERLPAETAGPREVDIEFMSRRDVSVFDGILNACEEVDADLVVMGTHGGGLLMGSLAEQMVRRAPCHVMVSRKDSLGNWPTTPGKILVPVDFSENARRAVDVARDLARAGDELFFLHVVATPAHPLVYADRVPAPLSADPELERRIESRVREWIGDPVAPVLTLEGDVTGTILDQAHAQRASLVVMGTRGLTGFEHFLVGSVAERVTRACEAPVLTVR